MRFGKRSNSLKRSKLQNHIRIYIAHPHTQCAAGVIKRLLQLPPPLVLPLPMMLLLPLQVPVQLLLQLH
jgi:hypothetical protein